MLRTPRVAGLGGAGARRRDDVALGEDLREDVPGLLARELHPDLLGGISTGPGRNFRNELQPFLA